MSGRNKRAAVRYLAGYTEFNGRTVHAMVLLGELEIEVRSIRMTAASDEVIEPGSAGDTAEAVRLRFGGNG